MKKIVANLKMNLDNSQIKEYLIKLIGKNLKNRVIVCPSFTSLSLANFFLKDNQMIDLGAQNICDEEEGKCTGEVSGKMLKACGVEYVIVGHSERRSKFRESGKSINKKIKVALKNKIKVILCVGEQLAERNLGKAEEVVKTQLLEGFKGLYENELENIIIAYEPVWAIGTGKLPQIKDVENIVKFIRKVVCEEFSPKSEKIEVLYGGSIDVKNCSSYAKIKGINGLLVGGASLDVDNLTSIAKSI